MSALERLRARWALRARGTVPYRHKLTFSAGVAARRRNETPDELLARADGALYEAKETGRDRVVVAARQDLAG